MILIRVDEDMRYNVKGFEFKVKNFWECQIKFANCDDRGWED